MYGILSKQRFLADKNQELSRYLLELIVVRAIVLLLGLNLADRLGILQERFGHFPFLPLFNILALILTVTIPGPMDVRPATNFSSSISRSAQT